MNRTDPVSKVAFKPASTLSSCVCQSRPRTRCSSSPILAYYFWHPSSSGQNRTRTSTTGMAYSVLEAQHIRVLTLEQSAQHDSIITCSLAAVSLSESARPQYEALSYVWGEAAERNEILLDGQPTSITRNLWTALKYIRKSGTSRTLWIDAICINQNDMHERNEQVRQMGQIYSQASRVLIWLGPPDAEIENTMLALLIPGALEGRQYKQFPKDIALGLRRILSQPW
jgi:hypothetical protein